MNRAQIIETYNLPRILQSDAFKEAYRDIRALVENKGRAYERLIEGGKKTNRRTATKSKGSGTTGVETARETS